MTTPVPTAVPFTPHLHHKSTSFNTSVLVHYHQRWVVAVLVVAQSHALTEVASLPLGTGSFQSIPDRFIPLSEWRVFTVT